MGLCFFNPYLAVGKRKKKKLLKKEGAEIPNLPSTTKLLTERQKTLYASSQISLRFVVLGE